MKKTVLLLLFSLSITLQAQTDPLSQYLNRLLIPSLVTYDSITVSLDSGSAFSSYVTARQHYFTNGHIDTLNINQQTVPVGVYKGEVNGKETVLKGIDLTGGPTDTADMVKFYQDNQQRDSAVKYYTYDAGSFTQAFDGRFVYNGSQLSKINIYVSGSFIGDWKLYYDQQRIDSIYYQISVRGTGPGYIKYEYDSADPGRLEHVRTYEDVNSDGELDLIQHLLLKNNSQDEVVEITILEWDTSTLSLQLTSAVRYDIHSKSSIRLEENPLTGLQVYPIPAHDLLHVQNAADFETYRIVNLTGKVVQEGNASGVVDLKQLKSGNYMLVMESKSSTASRMIIKY